MAAPLGRKQAITVACELRYLVIMFMPSCRFKHYGVGAMMGCDPGMGTRQIPPMLRGTWMRMTGIRGWVDLCSRVLARFLV
jgi:hypothetical protein